MIDVKELKMPDDIYVSDFDINVRPYLTGDDIIEIGEKALYCGNSALQKWTIILEVLDRCTDIPKEYITVSTEDEINDKWLGFDMIIQSGLWDSVECLVDNLEEVWDYVMYGENRNIALANFIRVQLPEALDRVVTVLEDFEAKTPKGEQWTNMIDNLPKNLSSILDTIKADGNAEILNNAMKMSEVSIDAEDTE